MNNLVSTLLKYRPLMLVALGAWLVAGIFFLRKLDIEAYPDPSPPLVEIITQNPSWSAEEMEQQVTVPVGDCSERRPSSSIHSLHQHLRPERREDVFRLRLRLLHRSPGSPQPPSTRNAPRRSATTALAVVSDRRNLPLPRRRTQVPQRTQSRSPTGSSAVK